MVADEILEFCKVQNIPITSIATSPSFSNEKRRVIKGTGATHKNWNETDFNPNFINKLSFGSEKPSAWMINIRKAGFFVIDIDVMGESSAEEVMVFEAYTMLFDLSKYIVKTGSGGIHFYFKIPEGIDSNNLKSQINIDSLKCWLQDKNASIDILTDKIIIEGSSYKFEEKDYIYENLKGSITDVDYPDEPLWEQDIYPNIFKNINKPTNIKNFEDADSQLLINIIENLDEHRWNNYNDFITIGMICFNEGLPLEVWENYAKIGIKNKPGDCAKHWKGFRKSNLTQASLWRMLKEDNIDKFNELRKDRKDFYKIVENDSHAEIALYFFNMKPNNYLYEHKTAWFILQSDNLWKEFDYNSIPATMLTDIYRTLNAERLDYDKILISKLQYINSDTTISEETRKDETEKIENKKKKLAAFGKNIGIKHVGEGIIAYLKSYYAEHTQKIIRDAEVSSIRNIMNENRHLFACNNAVYDLHNDLWRNIIATDYISIHCGYPKPKPNPIAKEAIRNMLYSIWENEAMTDYFMKIVASCLSGTRNFEEFYILTGAGRNGKGMIVELIQRVFGNYFHHIANEVLTTKPDRQNTPNPDMAKAVGKRFLETTEPESNAKIMEGTMKAYTGGDPITARDLYGSTITYKPQFGLFLQANNIPKLSSLSRASIDRLRLIPFPLRFVSNPVLDNERLVNPELKNVLCVSNEWRDEFLLLLIEYYKTIKGQKFIQPPKEVNDKTNEYVADMNKVGRWFEEHYEKTNEKDETGYPLYVFCRDVYNHYKSDTGYQISDKEFKAHLEFNDIYSRQGTRAENKGNMIYSTFKPKTFS